MFNFDNSYTFSCKSHFCREPTIKIISFQNHKHGYLIRTVKGTVGNLVLLSLYGGSLKITLSSPFQQHYVMISKLVCCDFMFLIVNNNWFNR